MVIPSLYPYTRTQPAEERKSAGEEIIGFVPVLFKQVLGQNLKYLKTQSQFQFHSKLDKLCIFFWAFTIWTRIETGSNKNWKIAAVNQVMFIFQSVKRQSGWNNWKRRDWFWRWLATGRIDNVSFWMDMNAWSLRRARGTPARAYPGLPG